METLRKLFTTVFAFIDKKTDHRSEQSPYLQRLRDVELSLLNKNNVDIVVLMSHYKFFEKKYRDYTTIIWILSRRENNGIPC